MSPTYAALFFSGSLPRVGSRAHELSIYYLATVLLNARRARLFHISPAMLLASLPERVKNYQAHILIILRKLFRNRDEILIDSINLEWIFLWIETSVLLNFN